MGDSGYDNKEILEILKQKGYTPIIKQNRRNIKNEKLLRPFNKTQSKIYKKRIKIENYHSWIKKFTKISSLHERNIDNYMGLLYLGISVIIQRRIWSNNK